MVTFTLKLGISVLNGGNILVQQVHIAFHAYIVKLQHQPNVRCAFLLMQKMLDYLKEKRDVGFFKSLSGLMMSCR